MSSLYLYFFTFSLFIYFSSAQISDKRLCADLECKSPVSKAKALKKYFSPDKFRLSFDPNQDITIYSKSAGSDESLWGAEINGKRGYIPKNLVREMKIITKPTILVDTEITNISRKPKVRLKEEEVNPSKVDQNYKVIEGTTIYAGVGDVTSNQDSIVEAATEPSDITKIDPVINDDHSTEKINVSTDIPNSEDLQEILKPKVIHNGVLTESILKSSDDNNSLQDVIENASQDHIVQTIDSAELNQQKGETEKNNITIITHDTEDDDSNYKENNELSEESENKERLQNSNPFSFVSNAIKDVLASGSDFDEDVSEEKLVKQMEDHKLDSAELNISDSGEKKFEPQKQLVDADDLNDIQESAASLQKSNPENKIAHKTSELNIDSSQSSNTEHSIGNSLNSVESVSHIVSSLSENVSTEYSNVKVASEVQSNSSITENSTSSESADARNPNTIIKDQNVMDTLESESEIAFITENSTVKNHIVEFPSNIKEPTSSEFVNSKTDTFSATQNIASTLKNEVPSVNEISSVEINSNSEERPLAPSGEKEDVNTVLPISDVEMNPGNDETASSHNQDLLFKNTPLEKREDVDDNLPISNVKVNPGRSDSETASSDYEDLVVENTSSLKIETAEINSTMAATSQNEDLVSSHYVIDHLHEESDSHETTESNSHYDNNVSKEQNDIQDNNIPSYDRIGHQEISDLDSVGSVLDHDFTSKLKIESTENNENIKKDTLREDTVLETPNIFSYFDRIEDEKNLDNAVQGSSAAENLIDTNEEFNKNFHEGDFCIKEDCPYRKVPESSENFTLSMDLFNFSSDVLIYLVTTAVSVIIFLLGHFALDKSRREGPLLIKINKLEKELLILLREKEILVEQVDNKKEEEQHVDSEQFLSLQQEKEMLEEKVINLEENMQTLEKELENSTEVGLELNRMLSEVLNSENAGQTLMLNIEGLQAQLSEQQGIVSSMKEVLSLKEIENHELNLELDIANKKVFDLQTEIDKLLLNTIKLEEDKGILEKNSESQIMQLKSTISLLKEQLDTYQKEYTKKIEELDNHLSTSEHNLQLKTKEFEGLKSSMKEIKDIKNANTLESLLEVNSIKAELEQLKMECQGHCDRLRKEKETNSMLEKKVKSTEEQITDIKNKFDETDRTKLELETKLQVLTNYFKEKEEQLQKELSKYESMWSAKQGEATSTSERIKYLQSEVQNYKAQNETLKQEIVSQEVELKGQISVLEKKVHENWVSARQAERRLEELKQEAAQLRNRLTLRERALQDDRLHNRMQSPLEQGGDQPISPLHLESPASPPLLFNSRDHITKSPPILGMPPPFLPPPTGSSFLPPPPPNGPSYLPPPPLPFMPPPPHDMFPGDHRPPPLGRMSSPPLNSRYSPSRPYSPYDRSPSPSYDESEYGTSPVHRRNYSQFNRRRDHRSAAMEKFNGRSGTISSGSENSNESLDEINHQNSKV